MKIKEWLVIFSVTAGVVGSTHVIAGGTANDSRFSNLSAQEQLGRVLYFDETLSINKNQACASCHFPPGFADPANAAAPFDNVVSLGSDPSLNGGRNAPSAAYAAFSPFFHWNPVDGLYVGGQFWDGRANTLADQAKGPFLNPVEMAMPSKAAVLERIAARDNPNTKAYADLWDKVYNVSLPRLKHPKSTIEVNALYDMMAEAIAAFEKTRFFSPFTSKFDYYLAGQADLSAQELRGLGVFNGNGQCNACHTSDALVAPDASLMPPLFTDFSYDNIGVPKSSNALIAGNPADLGLGGRADIAARDPSGAELGKHKVMTLRNIAVTPPYAHNGFFATLEDIVHFYNTRDVEAWPAAEIPSTVNRDELGNLGLSADEEADLVAFLKTLTDGYGPVIYTFPFPPAP